MKGKKKRMDADVFLAVMMVMSSAATKTITTSSTGGSFPIQPLQDSR